MTEKERIFSGAAKLADIALSGAGLSSILLLLYVVYYYAWTGQRQFSNPAGSAVYYGLPASLAVLLFSCLLLRKAYKINLALFLLSLATSLYGVELFLNLFSPTLLERRPIWVLEGASKQEKQKRAAKIEKQFGVRFDTRDRIEVIADLKKRGIDAVPAIIPRYLLLASSNLQLRITGHTTSVIKIGGEETLPLAGVANRATVMCNETGEWITYRSDEHGFNNPEGIWHLDRIDIVSLGDSFTQGYCLPREKSFMGVIRQRYPATLNLGMAGDGPLYMLATLKEYLSPLKPQIVLWCYFEGDALRDLQIERKSKLLMQYLNGSFNQGLVSRQNAIDQALLNYIEKEAIKETGRAEARKASQLGAKALEIVTMGALRKRLGLSFGETSEEKVSLAAIEGPAMDLLREILSQAKGRVHGWGGKLYFVYLPSWQRYANRPEIGAQQRARVLDIVGSLDIPMVDMHPVFAAQDAPLALFPFEDAGHYIAAGHELVGREILKALSAETPIGGQLRSTPNG